MRTLTLSLALMVACAVPASACVAVDSRTSMTADAGETECQAKGGRCSARPIFEIYPGDCKLYEKLTDDSCMLAGRESDSRCCVPSKPTRCDSVGGTCMFGGCTAPHFHANGTCDDPQQACCGGADDKDGGG